MPPGTDCASVKSLHQQGHEIASLGANRKSLFGLGRPGIEAEVVGSRQALAQCGVPAADIVGLRAPYLETKADVREVLADKGFLYDRWIGAAAIGALAGAGGGQGAAQRAATQPRRCPASTRHTRALRRQRP